MDYRQWQKFLEQFREPKVVPPWLPRPYKRKKRWTRKTLYDWFSDQGISQHEIESSTILLDGHPITMQKLLAEDEELLLIIVSFIRGEL
jgi:hypothetical protein